MTTIYLRYKALQSSEIRSRNTKKTSKKMEVRLAVPIIHDGYTTRAMQNSNSYLKLSMEEEWKTK